MAELFLSLAFIFSLPIWVIGYSRRLGFKSWLLTIAWVALGINSYTLFYTLAFIGSVALSFTIYFWNTTWKFRKLKNQVVHIEPNPLLLKLKMERELRKLDYSYYKELSDVKNKIAQLIKDNEILKKEIEKLDYEQAPQATRQRMAYYTNQSKLLQMKEKEKYLKIKELRLKERDLFKL